MTHTVRSPLKSPADLLIATLAVMILALLLMRAEAKRRHPAPPSVQIGVEARIRELQQASRGMLGQRKDHLESLLKAGAEAQSSPWDQALFSILTAEEGDLPRGRSLALEGPVPPGPAGESFRRCWSVAYLGEGSIPSAADRAAVALALRQGYAAQLLEARLLERAGSQGAPLRAQAQQWARNRSLMLVALGSLALLALGSGALFAAFLAHTWQRPRPEPWPSAALSGRELLIAFLGWFLAYLLSGTLVGGVVSLFPPLRPLALPLVYGFHACVGLTLLCHLQGVTWSGLAKSLFAGVRWNTLAWAGGFAVLAMAAVLTTTLALSPFLNHHEPPQRELMNLVTGASSAWKLLPFFLLATVVAPLFEETLFRGTLLPWLGQRFQQALGPRWGWPLALALSALAFGAIHLEPAALPTISVLGLVLGLACLRTGSLTASVVVHGIWNGSVLIFYRVLMT